MAGNEEVVARVEQLEGALRRAGAVNKTLIAQVGDLVGQLAEVSYDKEQAEGRVRELEEYISANTQAS